MVVLGVNASRARSGGAVAHILGVFSSKSINRPGQVCIHIWSYPELLKQLPSVPWIVKHTSPLGSSSILYQLWWEFWRLPTLLKFFGCNILLNIDAGSVCGFAPAVTMSRDMLSYEKGEIQRFGWGASRIRLLLLRYIQNSSFRRADGVIFLSKYAAEKIQEISGHVECFKLIPHGINTCFETSMPCRMPLPSDLVPIRLLYISNVDHYKHHCEVVEATKILRNRGFNVILSLVGGGHGGARKKLEEQINISDPDGKFVTLDEFLSPIDLKMYYSRSNVFIFASSCENLPNTLLEAMSTGAAIACSIRGPMPEILANGGLYFNPEDPYSIAKAVEDIIEDETTRSRIMMRSKMLASSFSWERCSRETLDFVEYVLNTSCVK